MLLRRPPRFAPPPAVVLCARAPARADRVASIQHRLLLRSQLNVADPQADRTDRNPDDPGDLLDRQPLLGAQAPGEFSLLPLHEHMFACGPDGTPKSNPAIPPTGIEPV